MNNDRDLMCSYKQIIECNIDNFFPTNFISNTRRELRKHGIPLEYLLSGLLSTSSLYLGQTLVNTNYNSIQYGISIFSALICPPTIEKSIASSFFSSIIYRIERFLTRQENISKISHSMFASDILTHLDKNSSLIVFLDECPSPNVYQNDYTRGCFVQLHNTPENVNLYVNNQRLNLHRPRLNFYMNANQHNFSYALRDDRINMIDGIWNKFLCNLPPLGPFTYEPETTDKHIPLISTLFILALTHLQEKVYNFAPDTLTTLHSLFNKWNELSKIAIFKDFTLSCHINTFMIKLVRVCAILKALDVAFTTALSLKDATHERLSEQFERESKVKIETYTRENFLIDEITFSRALELCEYFFKHLLKLSGFEIDTSITLELSITKIINNID